MLRRTFMIGAGALAMAPIEVEASVPPLDASIKPSNLPEQFQPSEVRIRNDVAPNEIHVDPVQFALYYTLGNRRAMRYAVGIGRVGLYESGEFFVGAKKAWPSWTPTPDMIERDPASYKKHEDGMPGGPTNPLGARALYLFQPGRGDTFLRIHGTHLPSTIGKRVSNGCARLVNDHIVEFYNRVPLKTRVVLHPATA
ncbi:L,D-transpeptidase [Aliishimia ponticola]|uniref:L,D-transpeptidase n=1 Tax=Aliishimia ponticola TaxID=2499833 RepID=A0A4S4NKF9_9RHOB|nr:L,D-transpeptidase [Aliishimia ponticola]THH38761.1 L,D-transpeptidase [Aliishimia ponticola]